MLVLSYGNYWAWRKFEKIMQHERAARVLRELSPNPIISMEYERRRYFNWFVVLAFGIYRARGGMQQCTIQTARGYCSPSLPRRLSPSLILAQLEQSGCGRAYFMYCFSKGMAVKRTFFRQEIFMLQNWYGRNLKCYCWYGRNLKCFLLMCNTLCDSSVWRKFHWISVFMYVCLM